MTNHQEFLTPSEPLTIETEVRRSRFLTTITCIGSKEEFLLFYQDIKRKHPGANHHCYAYIIGPPETPENVGSSDDGEPSGTAGMPMLAVLKHHGLGNVAVVVTRYFGGVKLGTGGLVRAYSNSVRTATEKASLQKHVPLNTLLISFHFCHENAVRHYLRMQDIQTEGAEYSDKVSLLIQAPQNFKNELQSKLMDLTKGAVAVTSLTEG